MLVRHEDHRERGGGRGLRSTYRKDNERRRWMNSKCLLEVVANFVQVCHRQYHRPSCTVLGEISFSDKESMATNDWILRPCVHVGTGIIYCTRYRILSYSKSTMILVHWLQETFVAEVAHTWVQQANSSFILTFLGQSQRSI